MNIIKSIITPKHVKESYIYDLSKNANIEPQAKTFLWIYRIGSNTKNKFIRAYCLFILRKLRMKYGLEIGLNTRIGVGFYLGHAFNITINPHTVIGNNVSVHKGVLIGASNRGSKRGSPMIGNRVWIGCNVAIVGKIVIEDDVLIAPNSYVNVDIPSHSVVFGNPCIIKHKDNATEKYINHIQN